MRNTALFAAALLATSLAQAGSYINLPFAPQALSGDGRVATDGQNAWTADAGHVTQLAGATFVVSPVSWDGSRIGNIAVSAADGFGHVGYYNRATAAWTGMSGGLGGTPAAGGDYGALFAMSGDGRFLGGYARSSGGAQQEFLNAALWNANTGAAIRLGAEGVFSRVNALSYDGRVAAGRLSNTTAVVWTDYDGDGNYVQSTLPGTNVVEALSSDGKWAVGDGGYRYNLLTNEKVALGTLNAGWRSFATDISADGKTVVGFERSQTGEARGYIWREGIGNQSLDTFLASQGIDPANAFEFRVAVGISDDGLTIAGYGTSNVVLGPDVGFLATLNPVPEPASYALLLAGLGAVTAVARRRRTAA